MPFPGKPEGEKAMYFGGHGLAAPDVGHVFGEPGTTVEARHHIGWLAGNLMDMISSEPV